MKKTALHFVCWMISSQLLSQSWVQIGDLNNTPRVMLNDTVSGKLLVSGNFRFNGTDTLDGFFAYDGSAFSSFGRRRYECTHLDCNPAFMIARFKEQIYFSGGSLTSIDGVSVNGIGQWDGSKWSAAMPGLYNKETAVPFLDGYCVHDGNFYGVGFFRTAEGDTCNSVARWDGERWTGLDFPPYSDNSLPRVSSAIFYQDQLYVAGNFSWELGGGGDIARLDSTGWQMVGGGLRGGQAFVSDMKVYKGELYVCGYFRKADGNIGNGIMRWDGHQWKDVGEGFCTPSVLLTSMEVFEGKLYVVGIFNCEATEFSASNIATWDGERWWGFGNSVFNNKISYIATYKGEIYVGGGFTEVDGQPLKFFAKWGSDKPVPDPAQAGLKLWPNPTSDMLHLDAPGPIGSLRVYDALGRDMGYRATLGEEAMLDVSQLPPGWYLLSAVLKDGGRAVATFIKI